MTRNASKESLNLSMHPSWWLMLGHLAEEREETIGVLGIDPEPWEVLNVFAEAVGDQFGLEGEASE
jgi:hypothetical protein